MTCVGSQLVGICDQLGMGSTEAHIAGYSGTGGLA